MEAEVVVPRQPGGGGKMKNEPKQGKNLQVLRNIGNLATLHVVEGKISRPMIRSFCAQLLANGQVAAEKNKILLVVDEGVGATRKGRIVKKAAEPQKVYQHAKDENVKDVNDEEENIKEVKSSEEGN